MAGNTMRAVQYKRYGGGSASLEHVEIPIPKPKKDEMLIKIEACSINPADWKIQKGLLRPFVPFKFPLHTWRSDKSGSKVSELKVGDRVVCKLNFWRGGGFAEYAVASEKVTVLRPDEISPADVVGLPMAGLTAVQSLKVVGTTFDDTGKGANILITAASGGVGSYAVQLPKLGNHHVIATCGARNIDLVKDLRADEVLDYKTPQGQSLKNSTGKKYDFIINCAYGVSWSTFKANLNNAGLVIDVTPNFTNVLAFIWGILTFSKMKLRILTVSFGKDDLRFLIELMREGIIKTVIDSKHTFENANDMWARNMDGHATGKVIVEM